MHVPKEWEGLALTQEQLQEYMETGIIPTTLQALPIKYYEEAHRKHYPHMSREEYLAMKLEGARLMVHVTLWVFYPILFALILLSFLL